MNITNIAIFLFAVLLSIGAVDSYGLFAGTPQGYDTSNLQSIAGDLTDPSGNQLAGSATAAQASLLGMFWYIVQGATGLFKALGVALNIGGYIYDLSMHIIPLGLCAILTLVVDLVYFFGVLQYFTGRSEKMMK